MLDDERLIIAEQSWALGIVMGASAVVLLSPVHLSLQPLATFLLAVATFHVGEFFLAATCRDELSSSAFLLDNGWQYPLMLLASVVEHVIFAYVLGWQLPLKYFRVLLSLCLTVVGLLTRFWAVAHCGPSFSHQLMRSNPRRRLVTTGPYAWVRHPAYTGFLLFVLGLELVLGNVACLIASAFMLRTFFLQRVAIEEMELEMLFPEAYSDYRRLVPRSGIIAMGDELRAERNGFESQRHGTLNASWQSHAHTTIVGRLDDSDDAKASPAQPEQVVASDSLCEQVPLSPQ